MTQQYLRFEIVPPDEILAHVDAHLNEARTKIQRPDGSWVGVTSLRMRTFARAGRSAKGMVCVTCGLRGTFFAVEQSPGQQSHHLNLYGINEDNAEILITHDHIVARALGGADNISNTQVMCSPCNNKKSRGEGKEVLRRRKAAKKKEEDAKINDQI